MTAPIPQNTAPSRPTRPDWLPDRVWPFPVGHLPVGGRGVAYTDTGGEGPVLLFVHAGLWSLLWVGLIAQLAPRYRCVTLDPPGAGLSDRVPRHDQNLSNVATATGALIDHLDLRDITLVLHDLGGLAALAASGERLDRIAGIAAVNTFAWRPRGLRLPAALRFFGTALVRELDALTGMLPASSSTRFGIGRHLDRDGRQAWRAGLRDRSTRRGSHRLFHDAARNHDVHEAAETALDALADRPTITIFGRHGDYFGFQKQWRRRRPGLTQHTVPRGYHFPMCANPALVAQHLDDWVRHQHRPPAPVNP
jgi:pimeloyl-ACP methyl ester carboxylesterase